MGRLIGGIAAGLVVAVVLVTLGTAAAVALLLPGTLAGQPAQPTAGYLAATLAVGVVAAIGGGFVAAVAARSRAHRSPCARGALAGAVACKRVALQCCLRSAGVVPLRHRSLWSCRRAAWRRAAAGSVIPHACAIIAAFAYRIPLGKGGCR